MNEPEPRRRPAWAALAGRKRSAVAAALALVLLAGAALDLAGVLRAAAASARRVQHTFEVIGQADGLMSMLKDAETGQRGYLLTGDLAYLALYTEAVERAWAAMETLGATVADNPAQGARLPPLRGLMDAKLAEMERTIALRRRGDSDGALAVVRSGEGKARMDALRAGVAAFTERERGLLAERQAAFEAAERAAVLRALLAAGAAFAAGAAGLIVLASRGRRTETALAASEARLRAIYDTVPVGLVTADLPSGRITGGNAHVQRVTGHPVLFSPDVNSYDEWVSYHPDGRRVDGHEYPIARMQLAAEDAPELEVLYDRQGVRCWTRIMGRVVKNEANEAVGAVVALLDIDDLKRAQEALAAANATLEAQVAERTAALAQSNAQLDAFAYTVSHDLRAPLRAMEGFARILVDDHAPQLGDKGMRYAGRIVAAAERMEGLIDGLLTYSRLQRARPELRVVDPAPIARRAAEDARGGVPDPDAIRVEQHPLPSVLAEPVILGQVLSNLIGNAAKFHAPGTPVRITVRAERRGARVRLWIEDNGIGIAPEHRDRIFHVFERLHGQETFPGTGIGLAIVREGTERMGGTCGVESAPGAGSRFWVELAGAPGQETTPKAEQGGSDARTVHDPAC